MAAQLLSPLPLFITGLLVLTTAFVLSKHKLLQLLRRTKWIMVSLLLIYAYTTPGILLSASLGAFSPSLEGLQDGLTQLMRLMIALAGLAVLLDRLHRHKLIAGLYLLLTPLQWFRLSRERLAVRLALTLHYAEVAMLREAGTWQDQLTSLNVKNIEFEHCEQRTLELPVIKFSRLDVLMLILLIQLVYLL
jgi:energy-coupling factor transport system permease protein